MKTGAYGAAWALAVAGLIAGCGSPRFADRPIVWRVDDRRAIPEPTERPDHPMVYRVQVNLTRRVPDALELRAPRPAMNTNALDEVPDSSWFTNRIGVRQVTPEEAAHGPPNNGPPAPPLTVSGGKGGGATPGFRIKDATGRGFLVKFDDRPRPELQTAADVIIARVLWTAGYNVPNDQVFWFRREDLSLSPKARISDPDGNKRPMTQADIDETLAAALAEADGGYRALASELLSGIPKGGFPAEGVRPDDPNDLIPHEHRRELRGLRVLCAWLNHADMKEENTLDMYVGDPGEGHLRHHFIDFARGLGAWGGWLGYEYTFDWRVLALGTLSLGLWKRPWEDRGRAPYLSVGAFTAEAFDPDDWRPAHPYSPFMEADAADDYWGARLVARFDRALLEAIVAEARLSQPEAAAWLVDTLLARREIIIRQYLERVSPLDDPSVQGGQLCLRDLGIVYGTADRSRVEQLDARGRVVREQTATADGQVCVPLSGGTGVEVLRLRAVRGPSRRPAMQVHVSGGRVIGLMRVEP